MVTVENKLNLSTVIEVLQDLFGYGSMISSMFIREVRPCDAMECPTLSIDAQGVFRYNPEFFSKWVNTERKLKEAVFHELLHPVLGDMHRRDSYISNFASDMVINALIGKVLGHCDLMKEFYSDTVPDPEKQSISGLLRPETNIRADGRKFARVYGHLWRSWGSTTSYYDSSTQGMRFKGKDVDSIEEVREAMEFLAARYTGPTVMLIGGHGHTRNDTGGRNDPMPSSLPKSGDGSTDEIGGELREILADEISDLLSKSAGYGDNLVEMAIKAIKANATMVRRLLEDFAATSEFNSFTRYMKHVRRRRSIFPRQLSRRDATMMGAGVIPIFYQTPRAHFSPQKDGMNVYIDVSGSMWSALPKVLGLLKASQKYLDGIYQFSNKVVPTTMRELFRCRGKAKISGTGGTDYNCIIDHAISIGARKIVILTDGYADCDVKRKNQCLANIDKACVIYAENHTKDEFWRKHYHRHYDLNELFKGC